MYFTVSKYCRQLHGEKQEAKTGRVAIKVLIMNAKRKFETIQGVSAVWV